MEKYKFVQEYEIKASARQIYPLLSTPTGLAEWFCDDVRTTPEKQFSFLWDGQRHLADIVVQKLNKMIKFQFRKDDAILHAEADPSFIELHLDSNDITQTTFLKVIDYSENAVSEDLEELWTDLIQKLREALGVG